jgi:predicted acetyltransferase
MGTDRSTLLIWTALMTDPTEEHSAHIEVIPAAAEEEQILANLLELYAHDFSEFHDLEIGADGRFGYKYLPLYWSDPGRHPFLVKTDGHLAGLILVKRGPSVFGDHVVWDMAEFFVLRAYRRRGIGTRMAHEVWRRFEGAWEVRVMQSNVAANHFWAQAVAIFAGERIDPVSIEKGDERWAVYRFTFGAP